MRRQCNIIVKPLLDGVGEGPHKSKTTRSNGLLYTVEEEGKGNLCDLPS